MYPSKLDSFLNKYQSQISSKVDLQLVQCNVYGVSQHDIQQCSDHIVHGNLVAFPTETVYGLGADAQNETAVRKIFQTKSKISFYQYNKTQYILDRPLTDPVISHVHCLEQALEVVDISDKQKQLLKVITDQFWPGPLTVICKADCSKIPMVLTANSGYMGLRCPNNQIALELIKKSKKLIAAPSANLFSHVSPTQSIHVFNDLYDKPISIIDGQQSQYGVESTIIKIIEQDSILSLSVLRNGSISYQQIQQFIQNTHYKDIELLAQKRERSQSIEENQQAPGQLIKHYSPFQQTFLFKIVSEQDQQCIPIDINLQETVVIDFGSINIDLKSHCLKYISLSDTNDFKEAMQNLYNSLRIAENVNGVNCILVSNLDSLQQQIHQNQQQFKASEFYETIYDKLYRSSAGNKVYMTKYNRQFWLKESTQL